MQYEPCNGTCYAYEDVFNLKELANDPERLETLMSKLLKAHGPACGNEHIRYGIDLDEKLNTFVGSFMHFNKLELVAGKDATQVLESLCDLVNDYYESEDGKKEIEANPGLGHSVCEHGEDTELRQFVLKASGLAA